MLGVVVSRCVGTLPELIVFRALPAPIAGAGCWANGVRLLSFSCLVEAIDCPRFWMYLGNTLQVEYMKPKVWRGSSL